MTKQTVEVERTVTDTETVTTCDYCGLADDEEAGKGKMITYEDARWQGDAPDLDIHTDCAKHGLGDLGPRPDLAELTEWDITRAYDSIDVWTKWIGTILLAGGVWLILTYGLALSIVGAALILGGLFARLCVLIAGWDQAESAKSRFDEWLEG